MNQATKLKEQIKQRDEEQQLLQSQTQKMVSKSEKTKIVIAILVQFTI